MFCVRLVLGAFDDKLHCFNMTYEKNETNDGNDITTDENVEKVLVNGVAEIKCDVSSNIDGDQVLLVVWYKNNLPIYR